MGASATIYDVGKRVYEKLVDPLRTNEFENFTLAIPDAQTTTYDSVQGWSARPPAVLECPGCDSQILQSQSYHEIDCGHCWRSYNSEEFQDMQLVALVCPRCASVMEDGKRHPRVYDRPEWATCPDCQYHWDLDHWY